MKFLIALFVSSSIVLPLQADDAPGALLSEVSTSQRDLKSNWTFGAGLKQAQYNYSESKMTDKGTLNGFGLEVGYHLFEKMELILNGEYFEGGTEYDGQTWGGTPVKDNDHYKITDVSILGRTALDTATVDLDLNYGLGRRVTDDADDSSPNDYHRVHNYNYALVGLDVITPFSNKSKLTLGAGFNYLLGGSVQTDLTNADSRLPNLNQQLNSGSAVTLKANYQYPVSFGAFYGGLTYLKWNIEKSSSTDVEIDGEWWTFTEPSNSTETTALQVGLLF